MRRNILFLFSIILAFASLSYFLPSALAIDYGCCFHPNNFCQNVADAEECCGESECPESVYDPSRPCSETKCEWQGCCLQTCSMTQYKDCNYNFRVITDLAPTYNCESAPECSSGCCVYMTSSNELGNCEIKTQQQCQPEAFYPNVQFHQGFSQEECNDICSLNQTPSGSISGFITDSSTLQPIENAQVVISGITIFSDKEGFYLASGIPAGNLKTEVFAEGYNYSAAYVSIESGVSASKDFMLSQSVSESSVLKGQIKNNAGTGVFGFVYYSKGSSFTDSSGHYSLSDVPSGQTEVSAIANYYFPSSVSVNILPNAINTQDFTLQPLAKEDLCGNGVINFGEECENGNDKSCSGMCVDCQCPDSCADAGGECYIWQYQCEGINGNEIFISGLDLCSAYNYQGSSYGCCDRNVEDIPPCIDASYENAPISATDITKSSGTICRCGNQYFDIANPEQGSGYCCEGIYRTDSQTCELAGTLSGFISSVSLNQEAILYKEYEKEPVEGADLVFTSVGKNDKFSYISYDNGFYLADLPHGNYSVKISKEGYEDLNQIFSISSAEYMHLNFTMVKLEFVCSPKNSTPLMLSVNHFQGIRKLEISWISECSDYIDHFEIYRDNQLIKITKDNSASSYIDSSIEWGRDYSYKVIAVSLGGVYTESNTFSVNSGSSVCENKFEDESWCFDSTKRVVCTENNQPILWDGYLRGSENGDCIVAAGEGSVCQMEEDTTWCAVAEDCSQTGISNYNIFGLFYNLIYPSKSCLYENMQSSSPQKRYCYYDSFEDSGSFTSVDRCLGCSQELTCFDYNSENACLQDNCLVGERTRNTCEWKTSYKNFQLLGKGYCTPSSYSGTDHCSECSDSSELFLNTGCTHDICSGLGRCYSSSNESECAECSTDTVCESYLSEEDCIGSNEIPFSVPGKCSSSISLQLSEDNCRIGRCAWKNNVCIKDGDGDGKDDCDGDSACLQDNSAPITNIKNIPSFINYEGSSLMFESNDSSQIAHSFYCIGSGCCPSTEIRNNTIFLSGKNRKLENTEGTVEINYYSIDSYRNVESIKTASIYFDTKKPSIYISYYLVNSSNSSSLSDIFINISVSEPSFCSDSFNPGKYSYLHEVFIPSSVLVPYTSLEDGKYMLQLVCTDLYQNKVAVKKNISIDRYHKIIEETPNMITLPESEVTISMATVRDQFYCYYKGNGDFTQNPFNKDLSGLGIARGEDYIYSEDLGLLQASTYDYDIKCYDKPNGKFMDSSRISFTIDSLSPSTNLSILNSDGKYRKIEEKPYSILNFRLDCTDAFQESPGGIGCGNTYFCITQENSQGNSCLPDSVFLEPETFNSQSSSYTICYYSKDLLNNTEETKCESFAIDHSSPSVKITSPDMLLTTHQDIEVSGIWNETSDISIFVKSRSANNEISESFPAEITDNGDSGEFFAELSLFSGYNQIISTAYDSAGNHYSDSIVIYYDNAGPSIENFKITDANAKNDPDTDYNLEYSSDIYFEAEVNDYLYSDIYDEKSSDISYVMLDIKCIESSGCGQQSIKKAMEYNDKTSSYVFVYSTKDYGALKLGDYSISIIMEDEFGNIAEENYTISIADTLSYSFEIFNYKNQRIDDLSSKGEAGYPVRFSFSIPKYIRLNSSVLYVKGNNPSSYTKTINLEETDSNFSYVLNEYLPSGIYSSSYIFSDSSGKSYHDSRNFVIEDTLPPAFNISIFKDGKEVDSVGFGIYEIHISSLEPVSEIYYLEYSFKRGKDKVRDISGKDYIWTGQLYIPANETYINLEDSDAVFKISSKDMNGRTGGAIIYGKDFQIDTVVPKAPSIFEPSNKIVYTKSSSYYFSGILYDNANAKNVIFKKNKISQDADSPGWENAGELNIRSGNSLISEWKSSLYGPIKLIDQNKIRINDYSSVFQPGRYIDFATLKTADKTFREIKTVTLYSDPEGIEKYYDISFDPAIETNISNYQGKQISQNILVYGSKYPDGWFDGKVQLSSGTNYLAVQVIDDAGNYGSLSGIYTIIYDSSSPEFVFISPSPDSYTNNEKPIIKSSVHDIYSGINKDSIKISIMEESYNVSCGQNYCIKEGDNQYCSALNCYSSEDSHEINISYLTPVSYTPGWKEVTIHAEDMAGNTADRKFGFWVDGMVPSTPVMEIMPGNKIQDDSPYTLYSNSHNPAINMNFLKYETIELADYYITDSSKNKISGALSFISLSDNEFDGNINKILPEGEYSVYISARKTYPNGTWSKDAFWSIPLVIDMTNPVFEASLPEKTNNANAILHLSYDEKNPYYLSFSGGASGELNYNKLYSPIDYLLQMDSQQGTKQVSVVFYDKAGNSASKTLSTYFDSLGPDVSDNYIYDNQWVKSSQSVALSAYDTNGISIVKYCLVSGCNPLLYGTEIKEPYILDFGEEQNSNVTYAAKDSLGNPSAIKSFSVLFDKTSPELQIYSMPSVNSEKITVFGKVQDMNIDRIDLSGDIVPFSYYPETCNEYISIPVSLNTGEGKKTINAKAYDLAGNYISKSISVLLDYDSKPLSVSYIENAVILEDYFISSEDVIKVHGLYLLSENSIIYPKANPSNLADMSNGEFTIELSSLDGYISLDGQEKTNIIQLVAEESSGKKQEISLKVIRDDAGPKITIEDPKGFAVKSSMPLIKISTDEYASCSLSYISEGKNISLAMQTSNHINHEIQITQSIISSADMNIRCGDLSGQSSKISFVLKIDNIKPIVYYADLYGSEVVSQGPAQISFLLFRSETTSITSFANEPVRCKYGNSLDYEAMDKFPDFDEYKFSVQPISSSFRLNEGNNIIYLLCEDAAGNMAQPFKLSVSVNTNLPIQIINLAPQGYTNQRNPEISLQTYRNSTCYADVLDSYDSKILDADSGEYTSKDARFLISQKNSRLFHTARISGSSPDSTQSTELKDNTGYGFSVICLSSSDGIDDSETEYVYFNTDFTIPDINIDYPSSGMKTNETLLEIRGSTEENSNYTIYVNDIAQTYPTITSSGRIEDFVILEDGQNIIRIEVYDKAGNFAKKTILVRYSRIGPESSSVDPMNNDITPLISQIKAKITPSSENSNAHIMLYEFKGQQYKISEEEKILSNRGIAILDLTQSPLAEGRYRYCIIPSEGYVSGQGTNVLFEIGHASPKITLSYPYSEMPYTGYVTNNPDIQFAGNVNSDSLLKAEMYINGELSSEFNDNQFRINAGLSQGANAFAIKATTLENDISLIHGDITLDSEGPSAYNITIK